MAIMKQNLRCRFVLILLTALLIIPLHAWAEIPILRVGIFLGCKEVTVKAEKGLLIYEIPSMKKLSIPGSNLSFKITSAKQGIQINNQLHHSIQGIKIVPSEDGFIQIQDRKYRGEIEIVKEQTWLNVINIIEIEQYLYGVLKKEISPEWPKEVLKAQAIAARTFALSNMDKFIDQGYNICATTNSQAYGGVFHEHPATNKAVNDTRGLIVVYQGEPINAVYHSDSGGYTENSEDVWGGYVPYLRSVPSNYEETVSPPNHHWDCMLTEEELLTKLTKQGYQLSGIKDVIIGEKTEAGRIISVDIIDHFYQTITMKTNDFRLSVGPTLIRSSLFNIEKKGSKEETIIKDAEMDEIREDKESPQKSVREILDEERDFTISELISLLNRPREEQAPQKPTTIEVKKEIESSDLLFIFSGKGNGHGVGLSQWGAYGMAVQGYNYKDILAYYYQGIQLKKLY